MKNKILLGVLSIMLVLTATLVVPVFADVCGNDCSTADQTLGWATDEEVPADTDTTDNDSDATDDMGIHVCPGGATKSVLIDSTPI